MLADSAEPDALSGDPRKRRRRRISREDQGNGIMSEGQKKIREADERPKRRECPVPKPSGLIGQVLGLKKEADDIVEPPSVIIQVERARSKASVSEKDQS